MSKWLTRFLQKEGGNGTDNTDRSEKRGDMSVLSVPSQSLSAKIAPYSFDDFEERIAIAEYDGRQNTVQAQRIAYQDAIVTILNANPPNDELKPDQDWFMERIKAAKDFLTTQGITQPR